MAINTHHLRVVVLGLAVVIVAGGLTATAMLAPDDAVDSRHCIVGKPPGKVLVLAFDVSDPLVAVAPREISLEVGQELSGLEKGDRVIALDIPGAAMAELPTVVDICDPGDEDNEQRLTFKTGVIRPILTHLDAIKGLPESPQSPIIETTLEIAHDPSLRDPKAALILFLVTDGLQNSGLVSAYRKNFQFPDADPNALKGTEIHLLVVKNARDLRRQPEAVDRLKGWLKQSGAHVTMNAPGWLTLARSRKRSGQS
jgi:hypothetical protein